MVTTLEPTAPARPCAICGKPAAEMSALCTECLNHEAPRRRVSEHFMEEEQDSSEYTAHQVAVSAEAHHDHWWNAHPMHDHASNREEQE